MTDAAAPLPLTEVSETAPPPAEGFVLRRADWGAFRVVEPGAGEPLLLRPTARGLRIERPGLFETVAWDDVVGVALTQARVGPLAVPVARVLFRRGPSLDLADVFAPGADELPMSLEAGGPPLLRVERLRMAVAAVVSASGLAPRTRDHWHRGGRGVPVPELTPRPNRLPPWLPPLLLVLSVGVLVLLFPALGWGGAVAIHVALLVHETGHALAMRLTRTPVRRILFLPAIGAATLAEHPFRTRWDDVRVALAGPATGVPVAVLALAVLEPPLSDPVRWGLLVAVAYNLLNLLPLVPMDGGRVVLAVVAGFPSAVRKVLGWGPLLASIAVIVLLEPGSVSAGLALVLAFGIVMTRLAMRRLDFHQWVLDVPLDPASMRAALRDLTWSLQGAAREDVDGGVPATTMPLPQIVLALGAYAALCGALLVATLALLDRGLLPSFDGVR